MNLTQQQQAAFDGLKQFADGKKGFDLALLEGYAGTGKTYLIGALVAVLAEHKIAIAAPTNKAVRVLKEKVEAQIGREIVSAEDDISGKANIRYASIHSLLGLQILEREDGSQECLSKRDSSLYEYDLVIIDECSMISKDMLARIEANRRRTKIIFVGDPAQLPPVGEPQTSAVFHSLSYKFTLTDIVRQAQDNPIIALSIAIRQAQDAGIKLPLDYIGHHLPPRPADAAIVPGGSDAAIDIALHEIRAGLDSRIIAFTNNAVCEYNQYIHNELFPDSQYPFEPGERVIAQQPFFAFGQNRLSGILFITSEEAVVKTIKPATHYAFPEIPAYEITLIHESGSEYHCYYPSDTVSVEQEIAKRFQAWRFMKSQADASKNDREKQELKRQAKVMSDVAWKMKKAFAPLRHAYAITAHKSQGSTFDTAIVDLADMNKIREPFDFNRALYVACTRPSKHLALIV